ncbi:replication initiation factor domain-containing protein [Marasmitruncus massiliensis]|uniref:replication initiation factor domain-containing protein n=1 Tax=Marasmitruncus massiliensis TaxID=1944642 RepID=UPI000C7A3D63|nr:replication initiation factor domain-containing protein [Marasmitruncus massiliensis]
MHEKNDIKILVDWLTFTIGFECFLEDSVDNADDIGETHECILRLASDVFGFNDLEFKPINSIYGYTIRYAAGPNNNIRIAWGGNTKTIMFDLTGEGCRLYESVNEKLDWYELIKKVQKYRTHNISRLDVACDTFGLLDMGKLFKFTREKRYVSRFKSEPLVKMMREETIDFGATTSRVMLRIYNKSLERICKAGVDAADVPENWIRLELQLRNDGADSFIRSWQSTGNISTAYYGLMSNQLRFVKERNEENPQRSILTPWWRKFLGNAEKIPMAYKGGLEYNLQSLQRYVFHQAGSSIRTWCELNDYDMDKFKELVKYRKLNERQRNLVDTMTAGADE